MKSKTLYSFSFKVPNDTTISFKSRTDLKIYPYNSIIVACAILNKESKKLFLNSMVENLFDSNIFRIINSDGSAVVRSSCALGGVIYPFNIFTDVYNTALNIQNTKGAITKEDSIILLNQFGDIMRNLSEV